MADNDQIKTERDYKREEYHNNRVAYYDSWVKAWINNRMEKDKQLLTLSSAAIGLLVTLFKNFDNVIELALWVSAICLFIFTLIMILHIFRKNTDYIETLLADFHLEDDDKQKPIISKDEAEKTKALNTKTKRAFLFFILGCLVTFILVLAQSGFIITKGVS